MEVDLSARKAHLVRVPVIALGVFEGVNSPRGVLKDLDDASQGWIAKLLAAGDFRGKTGEIMVQHTMGALPAGRVMLIGLGDRTEWRLDRFRETASRAAVACRGLGVRAFALSLELTPSTDDAPEALAEAAVQGALLGLYRFCPYKSAVPEENEDPEQMILLPGGGRGRNRIARAIKEAQVVAAAASWVRDLVSQPANRLTPGMLADQAVAMARNHGIRHQVLDEEDIQSLKMGGLLGVASGSEEAPRLIILEHLPKGYRTATVALVGKGITFDSGGISLKSAEKMDLMKSDMGGGATVLGTIQAAACLDLPVHLVGIVPATENLPSGSAYKPGDVVETLSGQTIEVTNTDAEGRVVLADALTYAHRYKPDLIIDLATLTGACVVALGNRIAGMMGNAPAILDALKHASDLTAEAIWPLPLREEYEDYLKSDIADVKNAGVREAGAIQGGLFLKKFVKDTPWVHIDMAGPVWTDKERPYQPKGATGFGVRLLIAFLKEYRAPQKGT